jgi:hypothetical protein
MRRASSRAHVVLPDPLLPMIMILDPRIMIID